METENAKQNTLLREGAIDWFLQCFEIQDASICETIGLFKDSPYKNDWVGDLAQTLWELVDEQILPPTIIDKFIKALHSRNEKSLVQMYNLHVGQIEGQSNYEESLAMAEGTLIVNMEEIHGSDDISQSESKELNALITNADEKAVLQFKVSHLPYWTKWLSYANEELEEEAYSWANGAVEEPDDFDPLDSNPLAYDFPPWRDQ